MCGSATGGSAMGGATGGTIGGKMVDATGGVRGSMGVSPMDVSAMSSSAVGCKALSHPCMV